MSAVIAAVAGTRRPSAMPLAAAAVLVASIAASLMVVRIGPAALAACLALGAICVCISRPRVAILGYLVAMLALDSFPVGPHGELIAKVYTLPPGVAAALPVKLSGWDYLLVVAVISALVRPRTRQMPALPGLVPLIPVTIALGVLVGLGTGGRADLAFHELAGGAMATLVFTALWRTGGVSISLAAKLALGAISVLAVDTLIRMAFFHRFGDTSLPVEYWYAHETALFLAIGAIIAAALLMRSPTPSGRAAYATLVAVMVAADALSGRRAGILALVAGAATLTWLLFPKRPAFVTVLVVVLSVSGAVYLRASWDADGPAAAPARAIKSQFQPSERDASSDRYRKDERQNVTRTLQDSPVLGVGFGQPFQEHVELADLANWELQRYTAHQNVLWIWLKTGLVGFVAAIGLCVLVLGRALSACRDAASWRQVPMLALVLGPLIVMFLTYGMVDLAFVGTRTTVPFAVALLLGLQHLKPPGRHAQG